MEVDEPKREKEEKAERKSKDEAVSESRESWDRSNTRWKGICRRKRCCVRSSARWLSLRFPTPARPLQPAEEELSEEDQALKESLELMVTRAQDADAGVQKLALESMGNEIRRVSASLPHLQSAELARKLCNAANTQNGSQAKARSPGACRCCNRLHPPPAPTRRPLPLLCPGRRPAA